MSYADIVAQMELLPSRLQSGDAYRNNELGNLRLNNYVWPGIALGANESLHSQLRPIFDSVFGAQSWSVLGDSAQTWSRESVRKSVEAYLKRAGDNFTFPDDVSRWVELELHRITFGIDLSEEQLQEFLDFQSSIKLPLVIPEVMNPILPMVPGIKALVDMRHKLIAIYSQCIADDDRGVFRIVPDALRPTLASALLDVMMFAGGLSVPHALTTAVALAYSDHSPAGSFKDLSKLSDEDLEAFVYEALRLFTPVVEFPWIDRSTGRRKLMIQMKALRDTSVWGEEPHNFHVRPLGVYRKYSGVGWAEPANGRQKHYNRWTSTHSSRGCPGQDLSLVMITEFLQVWRRMQGEWHVAKAPSGGITFTDKAYHTPPTSRPFTLTRGATQPQQSQQAHHVSV
jgi:hypothetical protein